MADDANEILSGVETLSPNIYHAMNKLTSDHAVFKDQPIYSLFPGIPALVKQDLSSVQDSASKLLATMVAFVPVRVSLNITFNFAYESL